MGPTDGERVRRTLAARLEALTERERRIGTHLRGQDGRTDADGEDRATIVAGDEVLERLDDAARDEIRAIRAALERLDEGRYERCARCGGRIDARRLASVPYAQHCVDCAAIADRRP